MGRARTASAGRWPGRRSPTPSAPAFTSFAWRGRLGLECHGGVPPLQRGPEARETQGQDALATAGLRQWTGTSPDSARGWFAPQDPTPAPVFRQEDAGAVPMGFLTGEIAYKHDVAGRRVEKAVDGYSIRYCCKKPIRARIANARKTCVPLLQSSYGQVMLDNEGQIIYNDL